MESWDEIRTWRKSERAALIAKRESLPGEARRRFNDSISARLTQIFCPPPEAVIGLCWPFKGEFDARFAARKWRESGAITALPEVVAKKEPLRFRRWWPGAPLTAGVYDIPVPDKTEVVEPDALIVPMNGFDAQGFRLGYGGGYFDRTLAGLRPRPLALGVSFEVLRLATIYPQSHDIPMDFVVTESAIYAVTGGGVETLEAAEAAARVRQLFVSRGLPRAGGAREYASPACYAHQFPGYFGESEGK